MSRETEQEDFCYDVWRRIKLSDTTQIHHLQGDRRTQLSDHREFIAARLSVFDMLPFAHDFHQRYRRTPSAVIKLGTQALIAVTSVLGNPASPFAPPSRGSITSELVSIEHDGFTPLGSIDFRESAIINRHVLRDKTDYYHIQVSRSHILVGTTAIGFAVTDLGSANGTDVAVEYGLSSTDGSVGGVAERLYVPAAWERMFTTPDGPQGRGQA